MELLLKLFWGYKTRNVKSVAPHVFHSLKSPPLLDLHNFLLSFPASLHDRKNTDPWSPFYSPTSATAYTRMDPKWDKFQKCVYYPRLRFKNISRKVRAFMFTVSDKCGFTDAPYESRIRLDSCPMPPFVAWLISLIMSVDAAYCVSRLRMIILTWTWIDATRRLFILDASETS